MISPVTDELPLGTGAAFQESQSAAQISIEHVTLIQKLESLAFLTSTGKVTNINNVNDLVSWLDNITFIKFCSVVKGAHFDTRIQKGSILSVNFCLRLHQYIYDMNTKTATIIIVPGMLYPNATSSTAALLTQAFQVVFTPHSTHIKSTTTSTTSYLSPVMNSFLALPRKSKSAG